jgi:hypothetical protein
VRSLHLISFQASGDAASASADPHTQENESEDEDIETALNKELESLKAERKKPPSTRRFQAIDSGANNCIFIQTTVSTTSSHLIISCH